MKPVYLTTEELKKEIGHGTDGTVYAYQNQYLVKLYHTYAKTILNFKKALLEEKIKIYQKGSLANTYDNEPLKFLVAKDEVRIRPKEAILMARSRQENVTRTFLPQNIVYLEGHFAGCLLRKVSGISLHFYLLSPFAVKKKIFLEILKDIEELYQNSIYHLDIANSPLSLCEYQKENQIYFEKGHSHILINPFTLKTHLIDLDGKSTIYTESKSEKYERMSLRSLNILLLEFLFSIFIKDYEMEEELFNRLEEEQIPAYYQKGLVEGNLTIPEIRELLKKNP